MKRIYQLCLLIMVAMSACTDKKGLKPEDATEAEFWLTTGDQSALLVKQSALKFTDLKNSDPLIVVNDQQIYQTIDGFGFTFTGGSAMLINSLPANQQDSLLKELFLSKNKGIGISYLRLSIGASDLSDAPFTYNDLPQGQTDLNQDHFSIAKEMKDMIPVLKKIVALNPSIKILGSPWTAPIWMKTKNSFMGGSLKPEYYESYAKYFVKYIRAMKDQGITIDALTIQNEPLNGGNVPSMYMEAPDQATFIKTALGPALKQAAMTTKIIVYDHNADRTDYPLTILDDPQASAYVDGSAFHLYGGSINDLSKVHEAHPDKNLYFTEQWVGGPGNFGGDLKWHVSNLIVGGTRNWCRNILEWNLAADPSYGPHTDGGCSKCLGAITIGPEGVSRNVAYYVIGHASKFVSPGSVRVSSNMIDGLENVAFKTPDGKKVLIVINTKSNTQKFNIKSSAKAAQVTLSAGAVATFVW